MKRKSKTTQSVTQAIGTRWVPGEHRMWTADNKRANTNKRAARGRSHREDYAG